MEKKYAILYFDTELNLGKGFNPNKWVNYKTVYYDDGAKALWDIVTDNSITTADAVTALHCQLLF